MSLNEKCLSKKYTSMKSFFVPRPITAFTFMAAMQVNRTTMAIL